MNAASLVLLALVAQATSSTASPEARAKAQTLLKEGAKLYEKGALAPALDKFNQAYTEFKSPKLLFNIGQASRDLGRLAEAVEAFERFLAEATDAPAEMTAEAKRSVAELEGKLGKLRIECSTAGAEIGVDGKPVGVTPIADLIWVMPGKHQVTARHPDTAPAIEDVEVNASWVHTVVLAMQPLAEPAVATPAPAPAKKAVATVDVRVPTLSEPAPPKVEAGAQGGRIWTWVAAGSAVVFAGAAVGLGLSMQSKFDSLNKSCGSASTPSGKTYLGCSPGDIDAVLMRKNLANVSWGLAAAAAATAGVLFFVEGRGVSVVPMAGEAKGLVAAVAY